MTAPANTVAPELSVLEVAKMFHETGFAGFPVVDKDGVLIGIITQYNMLSSSSDLHLPTLQAVLSNLPVFHKDKSEFQEEVAKLTKLTVRDLMDSNPLTLGEDASMQDAITMFQEHHKVNPIPVIDKDRKVIGVVSRYDFLKPLNLE